MERKREKKGKFGREMLDFMLGGGWSSHVTFSYAGDLCTLLSYAFVQQPLTPRWDEKLILS